MIVQSLDSFGYRASPFLIARVARIYPVFLVVFAFAVAVQPLATGFEQMAWIGPDSPARSIWSGGWPQDWGAVHRHAYDDDARAVSQRRAAQRLGGVPRRGVEPVDRVAVLPAGVADWRAVGAERMAWLFLAMSAASIAWHAMVPEAWQFSRAFLPNKAQYFALGVVSAIVVRDGREGAACLSGRARRHAGAVRGTGRHRQAAAAGGLDGLPCGTSFSPSSSPRKRGPSGWIPAFAGMTMGVLAAVLQSGPIGLARSRLVLHLSRQRAGAKAAGGDAGHVGAGRCERCSPCSGFRAPWHLPILVSWWLHEWVELPALRQRAMAAAAWRSLPSAPDERPVARRASLAQRLRLVARRRPVRRPLGRRAAARRTASAPPSPRPPRPGRSDRRWPPAIRRRASARAPAAAAAPDARSAAWRGAPSAMDRGTAGTADRGSASGSSRSSVRASSVHRRRLPGSGAVASPPSGTRRDSSEQMPLSNTSQAISPASGMRGDLRQRVLAAAEADLQPKLGRPRRERRQRIGRLLRCERQARQGDIEQALLPRPQPMAAAPAISRSGGGFSARRLPSAPAPGRSSPT